MRRRSGCPSKRIPYRSKVSRSSQFAPGHNDVTLEITGARTDAEATVDSIRTQLSVALQPAFRESLRSVQNIYGDGHAAERIVAVLTSTPLEGLLHKRAQPLPAELRPPQ